MTLSSPAEGADTDGAGADRPLFEEEEGKEEEEEEEAAAVEGGKGGAASARRQVLDDIDWGLVSRKVGSRSQVQCLEKWYSQLCPSMVERGEPGGCCGRAVRVEGEAFCAPVVPAWLGFWVGRWARMATG